MLRQTRRYNNRRDLSFAEVPYDTEEVILFTAHAHIVYKRLSCFRLLQMRAIYIVTPGLRRTAGPDPADGRGSRSGEGKQVCGDFLLFVYEL